MSNQQEKVLQSGKISILDRDSDYLIAAPHGDFDLNTSKIVDHFCEAVPWNCVVVNGYRTGRQRINVNRPTEGAGLEKGEELHTDQARWVYEAYLSSVEQLRGLDNKLYIEIHGNNNPVTANRIEIAQVGIPAESLLRIKKFMQHQLHKSGIDDIEVFMEGDDDFRYSASANKAFGVFSLVRPALHIEIPQRLRTKKPDQLVQFLVASLPNVAIQEFP